MEGSMYPVNQEMSLFGKTVVWPGVDAQGKFTNGDFNDPLVPPSFIPAETINLLLDNLTELIKKLGGIPNNADIDQLSRCFSSAIIAYTGIVRDASGRAKVAAPEEEDDIARKKEIDEAKDYALSQSENQQEVAKSYTNNLFISLFENSGYIHWPGMKSPLEIPALRFEGYSWYELNYRGNSFRAKGDNAKPFSSKNLTHEHIKTGAYIFKDDEQQDAIRNIKGRFFKQEDEFPFWGRESSLADALETRKHHQTHNHIMGANYLGGEHRLYFGSINFDASRVVPTAEENRSRNLTFALWVLVKDE